MAIRKRKTTKSRYDKPHETPKTGKRPKGLLRKTKTLKKKLQTPDYQGFSGSTSTKSRSRTPKARLIVKSVPTVTLLRPYSMRLMFDFSKLHRAAKSCWLIPCSVLSCTIRRPMRYKMSSIPLLSYLITKFFLYLCIKVIIYDNFVNYLKNQPHIQGFAQRQLLHDNCNDTRKIDPRHTDATADRAKKHLENHDYARHRIDFSAGCHRRSHALAPVRRRSASRGKGDGQTPPSTTSQQEEFGFSTSAEVQEQPLGVRGIELPGIGRATFQTSTTLDAPLGTTHRPAVRGQRHHSDRTRLHTGSATRTPLRTGRRGSRRRRTFDLVRPLPGNRQFVHSSRPVIPPIVFGSRLRPETLGNSTIRLVGPSCRNRHPLPRTTVGVFTHERTARQRHKSLSDNQIPQLEQRILIVTVPINDDQHSRGLPRLRRPNPTETLDRRLRHTTAIHRSNKNTHPANRHFTGSPPRLRHGQLAQPYNIVFRRKPAHNPLRHGPSGTGGRKYNHIDFHARKLIIFLPPPGVYRFISDRRVLFFLTALLSFCFRVVCKSYLATSRNCSFCEQKEPKKLQNASRWDALAVSARCFGWGFLGAAR